MIFMRYIKLVLLSFTLFFMLVACVTEETDGKHRTAVNKPEAFRLHIQLAQSYVDKKNRESARHHIRKAMDIDKNSAEVLNALALVYELEGESALAEESFKKAIKKNKNFSAAHNNYGVFLFGLKRYEDALKQFEAAAANLDFDGRAQSMINVGRSALLLGNTARAKAAFEHAAILNRGLSEPFIELADLYFIEQDYPKAKENLDRFMSLGQQTARSLLLAIRLERMFGNKDREASYVLVLKNRYPYSKEYLEYRQTLMH
ncbi:MAG: type IV pilus biogenesis/stability protein PilW [Cellvibrio sp.]|nr:type IV pilus biogenesis/stability protein PilW [Cellvibrio sp.]